MINLNKTNYYTNEQEYIEEQEYVEDQELDELSETNKFSPPAEEAESTCECITTTIINIFSTLTFGCIPLQDHYVLYKGKRMAAERAALKEWMDNKDSDHKREMEHLEYDRSRGSAPTYRGYTLEELEGGSGTINHLMLDELKKLHGEYRKDRISKYGLELVRNEEKTKLEIKQKNQQIKAENEKRLEEEKRLQNAKNIIAAYTIYRNDDPNTAFNKKAQRPMGYNYGDEYNP